MLLHLWSRIKDPYSGWYYKEVDEHGWQQHCYCPQDGRVFIFHPLGSVIWKCASVYNFSLPQLPLCYTILFPLPIKLLDSWMKWEAEKEQKSLRCQLFTYTNSYDKLSSFQIIKIIWIFIQFWVFGHCHLHASKTLTQLTAVKVSLLCVVYFLCSLKVFLVTHGEVIKVHTQMATVILPLK